VAASRNEDHVNVELRLYNLVFLFCFQLARVVCCRPYLVYHILKFNSIEPLLKLQAITSS
jgi:hypothetical protein